MSLVGASTTEARTPRRTSSSMSPFTARETGFNAAYAQLVQFAGDLQFLFRGEDDADGLFAVAQSGVVEANCGAWEHGADFRTGIQFADPDFGIVRHFVFVHHRVTEKDR